MKQFRTGLVVGKFCPLHFGHEYVIRTAMEQCDHVIILSYTSQHFEKCGTANRTKWLTALAERLEIEIGNVRVTVDVLPDGSAIVPDDNTSDYIHRQFCAEHLLNTLDTTVQAVFTSESYGPGFAKHLTAYFTKRLKTEVQVAHIAVDPRRITFPISGTELRTSSALQRKFTSPTVQGSFVPRILFIGAESTGKTTLVQALAHLRLGAPVYEYGRELFESRGGKLMYEDMEYIAKAQLAREDSTATWSLRCSTQAVTPQRLLCDTSPLTTQFYSQQWFGLVSPTLANLVWECDERYDHVFLCAPDFPMVQDGTRQDEVFRALGHQYYLDQLDMQGTTYTLLTGTLDDKINRVLEDFAVD